MKTTITIEIETEGFIPLYELLNPETGEPIEDGQSQANAELGQMMFSEADFHAAVKDAVINKFDYDIPELIMQDHFPEEWERLSDCCRTLRVKVDGFDITDRSFLLHRH